jgi:HAD superfamily hydrolase (TIGR01509 family)
MTKPIQAIVFDCFGVLATDSWLPFKQKYFGDNPALLKEATALNKKVDAGLASYGDFIAEMARMAGMDEATVRRTIEDNVPNEPLFDYIEKELKPLYKIGMLSNAGDNWLEQIFSKNHLVLFDAVALSYETGFIKPDKRAFESIAERLAIPIDACVLIDDQERYLSGAQDAGMRTILYRDFEQTKHDLERLLATSSV